MRERARPTSRRLLLASVLGAVGLALGATRDAHGRCVDGQRVIASAVRADALTLVVDGHAAAAPSAFDVGGNPGGVGAATFTFRAETDDGLHLELDCSFTAARLRAPTTTTFAALCDCDEPRRDAGPPDAPTGDARYPCGALYLTAGSGGSAPIAVFDLAAVPGTIALAPSGDPFGTGSVTITLDVPATELASVDGTRRARISAKGWSGQQRTEAVPSTSCNDTSSGCCGGTYRGWRPGGG